MKQNKIIIIIIIIMMMMRINGSIAFVQNGGIGRMRERSYPCDSDSVELTIASPSSFIDSHWNREFLNLPIPSPV